MYTIVYLCLLVAPFAYSQWQIHHLMTLDEVMAIFHTTHDLVPEYELIPVLYSIKYPEHGITRLRMKAFKQSYEIKLNTTGGYLASVDTPLWLATSNKQAPEGVQYKLIPQVLENIGVPMHDEDSGAALLVSQRDNQRHIFDGVLPSDIVMRSLPERITGDILYGENGIFRDHFSKKVDIKDFAYTYHHVVYKKAPKKRYENIRLTNPVSRMYNIPGVIYPEVLVVIDYELFKILARNVEQAVRYIVAFWNGVDLRYRLLTNPKIRINIAGIVIAMDEEAVPYIQDSKFGSSMVDADKVLPSMGRYFYREKRFPWKMYSMAICNTKLNLCNMVDETYCDSRTLGYAYVAGACNRSRARKLSEAVGVVEDDGGFSGIIPTTHELGHLLGAHHDGTDKDSRTCSASKGNIMSGNLRMSVNEFLWSNCSIRAFHKFLSEDRAKCLYASPPAANAIRRILPGKLLSPDEQCQKSYGGGSCNKNSASMCYQLKCIVPGTNGLCIPTAAAADGSPCGDGLICLDGKCVLEGTEVKDERIPVV